MQKTMSTRNQTITNSKEDKCFVEKKGNYGLLLGSALCGHNYLSLKY